MQMRPQPSGANVLRLPPLRCPGGYRGGRRRSPPFPVQRGDDSLAFSDVGICAASSRLSSSTASLRRPRPHSPGYFAQKERADAHQVLELALLLLFAGRLQTAPLGFHEGHFAVLAAKFAIGIEPLGVNDHLYDPPRHRLITAASCTTDCLAPVVKVVHEAIGIRHGQITTIHNPTNTNVVGRRSCYP
jgi:Glyceraldehyde 3-phosphate dehydrogenase, C-terminal domain